MSCVSCPQGTQCPIDKLPAYLPCANGTYSDSAGRDSCIMCPAGSKCPDPKGPAIPCSNGYYSKGGAQDCTICPEGHRYGQYISLDVMKIHWIVGDIFRL